MPPGGLGRLPPMHTSGGSSLGAGNFIPQLATGQHPICQETQSPLIQASA